MKRPDFVVITPMELVTHDQTVIGKLAGETKVMNFVVSKEIETSAGNFKIVDGKKVYTTFKQILQIKIHGVTLNALISFVARAVVIRFQAWVRTKGIEVGEKFMLDNPTYLHDISAALKGGTDTIETLKASTDPMAEIRKLIAAAGLQDHADLKGVMQSAVNDKPNVINVSAAIDAHNAAIDEAKRKK